MLVACLNPGSSSLKLSLINGTDTVWEAAMGSTGEAPDLSKALPDGIDAAAVRVVHGGMEFRQATLVDTGVLEQLRALSGLAPLHNPVALRLIDRVREARPGLPVVACFDTAFHATMPAEATTYPVPREWTERWGFRRFGFHGLSHAYAGRRAAEVLGHRPWRMVSCHIGAGASLCAIRDGLSVDTTMGFTPMEGLMMATRSGSVDPGLVLFALRQGLSVDEVERGLDRESGLLAVSGSSSDFQEVLAAADRGDAAAALAIDVFRHRLVQGIAAMAASMGGIDALVFTGGVGEHQSRLRQEACGGLRFLGVDLGTEDAVSSPGDRRLSAEGVAVDVVLVHAREDLEMAREAESVLSHGSGDLQHLQLVPPRI